MNASQEKGDYPLIAGIRRATLGDTCREGIIPQEVAESSELPGSYGLGRC